MPNKIKCFAFSFILIASPIVYAECYIKSTISLKKAEILAGPTDFQKLVTKDDLGYRCNIQFRVNIEDEWQNAEAVGVGPTPLEACLLAQNLNKSYLLKDVAPNFVSADTQMVCTDIPEIRVRKVKIGEQIWESETDLHRHPNERKYFSYKQTKCRMFTERNIKDRNLYTYQGVICQITNNPASKWIVVDKY